jgi:acyl dehydratase
MVRLKADTMYSVPLSREGFSRAIMIDVDVRSLREAVGKEIAVSGWMTIAQERIQQFAEATGDHQWIHVDATRAAAESPYKTTIAHGFLTLALVSSFARDAMRFTGLRMAINYGLNRVRFVSPVLSGARVTNPATASRSRGGSPRNRSTPINRASSRNGSFGTTRAEIKWALPAQPA